MQITDFHKTKAGRIALYVDGTFLLSMPPDVFVASGLSVGAEVDEDALRELAEQAELKKAKEKALSLLSYKEYTSSELESRLCRQLDEASAAAAVQRMGELGLLNDADYARRFARELSERKQFGPYRVRQEMRRKGLSAEQIEAAIEELAPEDTTVKIQRILDKKYPSAAQDEQVRRRAYAALLRLGYSSGDVRRAMHQDAEFE